MKRAFLPLLLLVCTLVYLPIRSAGFVWDDGWLIVENQRLSGPLSALLTVDFATLADLPGQTGYWRPVLMADYWLDALLVGRENPFLWHLHSLGWHLVAVGLLYRLLKPSGETAALVGAGFLAVHPVSCEAVAWVSARNDPMSAAGMLATLLAVQSGRNGLAGGLALLSLGTKESAILLPFWIVAWTRKWPPLAVWLALAGGLALRPWLGITSPGLPATENLRVLFQDLPALLGLISAKLLGLSLSSTSHLQYLNSTPLTMGSLLLLSGLFFGILWKGSGIARMFLWLAVLSLLPSLFAVAQTGVFGDRYLYLPLLSLSICISSLLPSLSPRYFLLPLALLLLRTSTRLPVWESNLSLFQAEVEDNPTPYNEHLLASALLVDNQPDAALSLVLPLIPLHPPFPELYETGLKAALKRQHYRDAVTIGEAGRSLNPGHEYGGTLAFAYAATGNWQAAEEAGAGLPVPAAALALTAARCAAAQGLWKSGPKPSVLPDGFAELSEAAARCERGEAPGVGAVEKLLQLGSADLPNLKEPAGSTSTTDDRGPPPTGGRR